MRESERESLVVDLLVVAGVIDAVSKTTENLGSMKCPLCDGVLMWSLRLPVGTLTVACQRPECVTAAVGVPGAMERWMTTEGM